MQDRFGRPACQHCGVATAYHEPIGSTCKGPFKPYNPVTETCEGVLRHLSSSPWLVNTTEVPKLPAGSTSPFLVK